MKKSLFFLLLITLIYQFSYGQGYNIQSGYIVTYGQDTIAGLIKDRPNLSEKILFKPARETHFKVYTPSEVALFYYDGGYYDNRDYYYKSIDIPLQNNQIRKLFLLSLVEGDLSLYQYKDIFFVGKSVDSLIKLEKKDVMVSSTARRVDKRYIGHLKYLIQGCPSLGSEIERTGFKADALSKVITAYNQCINPSVKTLVSKRIHKKRIKTGVRLSTVVSKADYFMTGYNVYTYPFKSNIGYSTGLFLQFPFKNKLAFQPEILITQRGSSYRRNISSLNEEQINFNITYLQVPFSMYYTFPTYKLRPFLAAGGVFSYILSSESYQSIGTNKKRMNMSIKEVGYRLSTGVSYPVFNKRILSLEYSYENNLVDKSAVNFRVHFTSNSVSLRMNF